MRNSFLNTLVVLFIIFQTFSICRVAHANPKTVTDVLIQSICVHARDHDLCSATLDHLKGKDLTHKPLLTLAENPVNVSSQQAQKTGNTIWNLHQKINSKTRIPVQLKRKERYYKCHLKYSDIRHKLALARVSMKEENKKEFKDYVSKVMNQAFACEEAFNEQPQENSSVPQEVGKLRDNLSILLAICDVKNLH